MKRHGPVNIILHFPKTEEGKQELARRVADIHADSVYRRINSLTCPHRQKLQLLDSIIASAKQRTEQQSDDSSPPSTRS